MPGVQSVIVLSSQPLPSSVKGRSQQEYQGKRPGEQRAKPPLEHMRFSNATTERHRQGSRAGALPVKTL